MCADTNRKDQNRYERIEVEDRDVTKKKQRDGVVEWIKDDLVMFFLVLFR